MKIRVFQIDHKKDEKNLAFRDYRTAIAKNGRIDESIYKQVYGGEVPCRTLEEVYALCNGEHKPLGYTLSRYPPNNKDWNEDLKELHGVPFLPAVPHRRWEEYERQAESLQYYPCRIEKLRSQLNAAFRNGQDRYLAEYALAGSVFFSQKMASNQDCDRAFSLSKQRLGMLYHPYRDRCRSTVLYRDLSAKIADVMQGVR